MWLIKFMFMLIRFNTNRDSGLLLGPPVCSQTTKSGRRCLQKFRICCDCISPCRSQSCTAERGYSCQRQLNTFLSSTMSQKWLNHITHHAAGIPAYCMLAYAIATRTKWDKTFSTFQRKKKQLTLSSSTHSRLLTIVADLGSYRFVFIRTFGKFIIG